MKTQKSVTKQETGENLPGSQLKRTVRSVVKLVDPSWHPDLLSLQVPTGPSDLARI